MEIERNDSREAMNDVVRLHREVYESEWELEPSFADEVAVHLAELSRSD